MKNDGEYTLYDEQDLEEYDYDYTYSFAQYTENSISTKEQEKLVWGIQLQEC